MLNLLSPTLKLGIGVNDASRAATTKGRRVQGFQPILGLDVAPAAGNLITTWKRSHGHLGVSSSESQRLSTFSSAACTVLAPPRTHRRRERRRPRGLSAYGFVSLEGFRQIVT